MDGRRLLNLGLDIGSGALPKADINIDIRPFPEWSGKPLQFMLADAKHLPFREACFDKVLAKVSLPYVGDELQALREVQYVLKQGGVFELSHHTFIFYLRWWLRYSKERLLDKRHLYNLKQRFLFPIARFLELYLRIAINFYGNRCFLKRTPTYQTAKGLYKSLSRFGFEVEKIWSEKPYRFVGSHIIQIHARKRLADEGEIQYKYIMKALGNLEEPFLDLGCGGGHVANAVCRHGRFAVGIDLLVPKNRSTPFVRCAAESLPFRDHAFNSMALISILEHVRNVDAAIGEVSRTLAIHGKIYVYAPNFLGPPYEHHFKFPFIPMPKPLAVAWFRATRRWWGRKQPRLTPEYILSVNYTTMHILRKKLQQNRLRTHSLSYEFVRTRKNLLLRALNYFGVASKGIYIIAEKADLLADGFWTRKYPSYKDYLKHQAEKLAKLDLANYDAKYRVILADRLRQFGHVKRGMSTICLGARIGTEVKAFHDLGCFAVGVDINPGDRNRFVLHGDFHVIQFPDRCVDVVFTNSLDHTINVSRVLREARRVLKPEGFLIMELVWGTEEGEKIGEYETFAWKRIDDIISLIGNHGFKLLSETNFSYPWKGRHICFGMKTE